ncbi:MAG: hypothetical protein COV69_00670 [Parcubacteria group bacterium CG11_big_fil_rev_8_21_14_0_20_39_14]|nr:MAG: hypothetical protein COV69_00670 [Parcubacteria group bacterium CG11_big_fil_rev_8_21_14_0_20_39_14]PIS35715.1 MAG: hypothetical protein COT36_00605 [Parcubacteria group bacterium CG08_land_8_20_14_0_20_38_56]
MSYFLYIIFAVLPSLVWLGFYLRQDQRPEPKRVVVKIFIFGMLAALLAIIFEKGAALLYNIFKTYNPQPAFILYVFVGIGFVEEFLKYMAVKLSVLRDSAFDEPFDALLYLIIAALGFAALENLLLFSEPRSYLGQEILPSIRGMAFISLGRMLTATFFHALCSGILGYFIALSFYKTAQKNKLVISGIIFATFLHGLYNFSIMEIGGASKYIIIGVLLILMVSLLSVFISKIKKLPSICK